MTLIHPVARPLVLAMSLALAAVVAPSSAIADGSSRHAAATNKPAGPAGSYQFSGMEDEAIEIELGAGLGIDSVMVAPSHGTLMTSSTPMKFIPHPDFNGEDQLVIATLGAGGIKGQAQVAINVLPVNDPPSFAAGRGRSHASGDSGSFVVEGWATAIAAGPAEEPATQGLSFVVTRVDDLRGSVDELSVSANGTLRYTLTGRNGVSTWSVQAVDSTGPNGRGGLASEPQIVRVGVGETTDLAIKSAADNGEGLVPTGIYQLFVSNVGKRPALASRVVDLPVDGGANAQWTCQGFDGGVCPKIASGSGPVDQLVDLPEGGFVVFRVSGVDTQAAGLSHRAFVQPPDHMFDIDLSNNEIRE
jgi:hypothetical protein